MKGKLKVTASGGADPGANLKPSKRPRPAGGGRTFMPDPVNESGRMDKAPPRRTPSAEIKGYLSKVAREDRETEKSQYKDLDRSMRGNDVKAIRADLKAAKGYKNGGCVMAGRGGGFVGNM